MKLAAGGASQDIENKGTLAGSADAGEAGEAADGETDGVALEVVMRGTQDGEPAVSDGRNGIDWGSGPPCPGGGVAKVGGGEGIGPVEAIGRSLGDDEAAVGAGAWAEVDDPISGADDGLVVLDNEEGVAGVAEVAEAGEEAVGIARVETGGGLVEDEGSTDESAAEDGGEPHALIFAAGEGVGAAVEGEIAEADAVEVVEPGADLGDEGRADAGESGGEREGAESGADVGDGQC
jgi:hypothetical protein